MGIIVALALLPLVGLVGLAVLFERPEMVLRGLCVVCTKAPRTANLVRWATDTYAEAAIAYTAASAEREAVRRGWDPAAARKAAVGAYLRRLKRAVEALDDA